MTTLTANSPLFSPHVDLSDDTKAQIIVFILGKKDKNSGTGFYLQENFRSKNTAPIDIVGFHDNKCIFFNSSIQLYPTPSENCSFCLQAISLGRRSSKVFLNIHFSILLSDIILSFGFKDIATSKNSLSKKGTRASTPHAAIDLLALKQS